MNVSHGNFPIWRGSKRSSKGCEGVQWDPRDPLSEQPRSPRPRRRRSSRGRCCRAGAWTQLVSIITRTSHGETQCAVRVRAVDAVGLGRGHAPCVKGFRPGFDPALSRTWWKGTDSGKVLNLVACCGGETELAEGRRPKRNLSLHKPPPQFASRPRWIKITQHKSNPAETTCGGETRLLGACQARMTYSPFRSGACKVRFTGLARKSQADPAV
jgi:hypothetical protein